MTNVYIDLDRTAQWFVIYSPFKRTFVDEFKARVPAPNRRWVMEERAWCVTRTYWETTHRLLYKHFGDDTTFHLGPGAEAAEIDLTVRGETCAKHANADYAVLGVRPDAPECVVHAAYLALETCWADPNEHDVSLYALDQTRLAYATICVSRGLRQEPPPELAALIAVRTDPENYETFVTAPDQELYYDEQSDEPVKYRDKWQ